MKKIASAAMLALAMGGAQAQVYVEGAFGLTNVDVDCAGLIDCDNDDTGFKLIGGYKVNPNVAVEFGYLNFGKPKATDSTYFYGDTHITLKTTAIYAGAALRGEIGSGLGAVARLGLANVDTKVGVSIDGVGSGSDSESSVNALFGLGLEYAVAKNMKLTGSIDFTKTAELQGETASLRLISIGLKYDF